MKKYKIKVEEIKTTDFELSADSKKEAKKMVEEVINETKILNLPYVKHAKHYNFVIKRVKETLKNNNQLVL